MRLLKENDLVYIKNNKSYEVYKIEDAFYNKDKKDIVYKIQAFYPEASTLNLAESKDIIAKAKPMEYSVSELISSKVGSNLFVFAEDKDGTLKKVFIKKDNRCVSLNSDSELFHIQASDDAKFTLFHPIKI